jgi:hypothetical protein
VAFGGLPLVILISFMMHERETCAKPLFAATLTFFRAGNPLRGCCYYFLKTISETLLNNFRYGKAIN